MYFGMLELYSRKLELCSGKYSKVYWFNYFTPILALCFNCPTPSLQSVSMSVFWLRPPPLSKVSAKSVFWLRLPPPKGADVILERSLRLRVFSIFASPEENFTEIVEMLEFWVQFKVKIPLMLYCDVNFAKKKISLEWYCGSKIDKNFTML